MTWILTRTGRRFDLLQPCPSQVFVLDIAHALAHLCRFNGHASRHYSVAQHSLVVASIVPAEHKLAALLHDATEAYVGDMVRPLKQVMPEYKQIEQRIWLAICERFDIAPELPECVREADMIALATERAQLMPDHPGEWECLADVTPLSLMLGVWQPAQAAMHYQDRLLALLQSTHRTRHTWERVDEAHAGQPAPQCM
ncbi:phosphohydrolase [Pseudomonas saudiphocaensis]|uniref:phosphohydrolase n=1 Tax=Pseudomonas saudiphocaensis TaxID=1499686 RepID=UPI000F7B02E7|nr:phosphohydrolase [Pseudomonas saudiphocaensis]RRV18096.1 phosphohydrolase [Pseudomonas saudiphocaensis]